MLKRLRTCTTGQLDCRVQSGQSGRLSKGQLRRLRDTLESTRTQSTLKENNKRVGTTVELAICVILTLSGRDIAGGRSWN